MDVFFHSPTLFYANKIHVHISVITFSITCSALLHTLLLYSILNGLECSEFCSPTGIAANIIQYCKYI